MPFAFPSPPLNTACCCCSGREAVREQLLRFLSKTAFCFCYCTELSLPAPAPVPPPAGQAGRGKSEATVRAGKRSSPPFHPSFHPPPVYFARLLLLLLLLLRKFPPLSSSTTRAALPLFRRLPAPTPGEEGLLPSPPYLERGWAGRRPPPGPSARPNAGGRQFATPHGAAARLPPLLCLRPPPGPGPRQAPPPPPRGRRRRRAPGAPASRPGRRGSGWADGR